jgi:[DsrC]-trisulfide reductase subunit M
MGLFFSLIAFVVLVVIGSIGGNVGGLHYIFGVVIPYIAIAVFVVGFVMRIMKWAKAPVPFRIPTTCGQQNSLDFIPQNKIDNPSTTLGVWARMALEVFFFRSLFRNTRAEIRDGKKLIYFDESLLWLFGLVFHWSFLIIFLRHFRYFVDPAPFFVPLLQDIDGFFQVGVPIIYMTNAAILVAVTFLFFRRIFDQKVKYISLMQDYFPLLLIGGIACTGILMRYFMKTDVVAIKKLVVGLCTFAPITPPPGIDMIFYLHLFLVCALLIYFPMSKLMHMPGVFLSPTRNMANNNRMKRHVNPWNDEFKLHYHTYAEYEDEFRTVMKAAGLPLDKNDEEAKDGK